MAWNPDAAGGAGRQRVRKIGVLSAGIVGSVIQGTIAVLLCAVVMAGLAVLFGLFAVAMPDLSSAKLPDGTPLTGGGTAIVALGLYAAFASVVQGLLGGFVSGVAFALLYNGAQQFFRKPTLEVECIVDEPKAAWGPPMAPNTGWGPLPEETRGPGGGS